MDGSFPYSQDNARGCLGDPTAPLEGEILRMLPEVEEVEIMGKE